MLKKIFIACAFGAASTAVLAESYLIDVRSPQEFAEAHAEGAINVPMEDVAAKIGTITTDLDAEIRLYCHSGRRAAAAQETLTGMGYRKVQNLGSFTEVQAMLEKEKETPPAAESVTQ